MKKGAARRRRQARGPVQGRTEMGATRRRRQARGPVQGRTEMGATRRRRQAREPAALEWKSMAANQGLATGILAAGEEAQQMGPGAGSRRAARTHRLQAGHANPAETGRQAELPGGSMTGPAGHSLEHPAAGRCDTGCRSARQRSTVLVCHAVWPVSSSAMARQVVVAEQGGQIKTCRLTALCLQAGCFPTIHQGSMH